MPRRATVAILLSGNIQTNILYVIVTAKYGLFSIKVSEEV